MRSDKETESDPYTGNGWNLLRISTPPESVAAPFVVIGILLLASLFGLGVFLITRLVLRVVDGSTDTVPAASAALTAIAAVFGAVFITWRTVVAHWQARASQQQVAIARESHYTTLFAKAVEQLGGTREVQIREIDKTTNPPTTYSYPETQPNLEVRLGAIYALERIARDSARDKKAIFEVLCAYARNPENSGRLPPIGDVPTKDEEFYRWRAGLPSIRVDMQACIYILGSDLFADLDVNIFDLSRANFQCATLSNNNLTAANLESTNLDATILDNTVINQATLDRSHIRAATTTNSSIENSSFDHSDISFMHSSETSFVGSGGHKARLSQMMLSKCDLSYCYFTDSTFSSVTLTDGKCSWISLKKSRLDASRFRNTNAQYANFRGTTIVDTVFFRTDLRGSDFAGSRLYKVGFFGCDLTGATGITPDLLADTYGDAGTVLPAGIPFPNHWSPLRVREDEVWAIMNSDLAKLYPHE